MPMTPESSNKKKRRVRVRTPAEKEQDKLRKRAARAGETPEQRRTRLDCDKERKRSQRAAETPEQHNLRLARQTLARHKKKAVTHLEPFIERKAAQMNNSTSSDGLSHKERMEQIAAQQRLVEAQTKLQDSKNVAAIIAMARSEAHNADVSTF